MISIEGGIKPFRITRENMLELFRQITARMRSVESITVNIQQFKLEGQTVQEIEQLLRDMRLPSTVTSSLLWFWGEPRVYMFLEKDHANYTIENASDMDEARQMEDLIVSFFDRHKTFRMLSALTGGMPVGVVLAIIAMVEFVFYWDFLRGRRTLIYPSIHLFIGLACATFIIYILWSILTREPPSFSFVHSIIFMKEKKDNVLWVILFSVILEVAVAIIATYLFVQ